MREQHHTSRTITVRVEGDTAPLQRALAIAADPQQRARDLLNQADSLSTCWPGAVDIIEELANYILELTPTPTPQPVFKPGDDE